MGMASRRIEMTAFINQPEMLHFRRSAALPKDVGTPEYHYNSLSRGTREFARVRYSEDIQKYLISFQSCSHSPPQATKGRGLFSAYRMSTCSIRVFQASNKPNQLRLQQVNDKCLTLTFHISCSPYPINKILLLYPTIMSSSDAIASS
jgi:hypothetical protein